MGNSTESFMFHGGYQNRDGALLESVERESVKLLQHLLFRRHQMGQSHLRNV